MIEIGSKEKPKVLIVDDEVEVLNSLADLLRKDFHIFATADVDEAQRLLVSHNMFSLVISDQRMPVLTGAELLAKASKTSPDTARILLTGYADIDAVIEAVNQGMITKYITKPWDAEQLIEILKPIAERHQLLQENRQLIHKLAQLNESAMDSSARIESLKDIQSTVQSENQTLKAAYEQLDKSFWHLKKIQEVLPICLDCGKVKTTDSSWEDVVGFLKKHSLFLSHGYCPECADKLMSQFTKD
ncbi:MAG: response regulator [Steroidobacteraceae bacterium]|nr:response regulator [Deltaproteobacteria bacterium]